MGWHEAYLVQARKEHAVMLSLGAQGFERCHQIHYLQMVTEKLAKAIATPVGSADPAPTTHAAFVRMLQQIKTRPEIRRRLGYDSAAFFAKYIDSLLELAGRIQKLSPDQAGLTQPNPEYPWKDQASGQVVAPVEHEFSEFDPRDPRMVKIGRLVGDLLRVAN